ncbi:MAG TPA: hypothetical protein VFI20_12095, partial [Terracidiphilus sp.]|nr:hypothetical protein [Terracidiphilus sp.]
CHVFMDWRELRPTAAYPWDQLCDFLDGRGVPDLDDALVSLELQPVHHAFNELLAPDLVRRLADLAEHPNGVVAGDRPTSRERAEFSQAAWARCEDVIQKAQAIYRSRRSAAGLDPPAPIQPRQIGPVFRERLHGVMRMPTVEAVFAAPWPAAARRVLPSPSPQRTATVIWGPILAWCAIETIAESIQPKDSDRIALDLFDRLRLREPLAQAFQSLGLVGEQGWRVAARIKVLLLARPSAAQAPGHADDPVLSPDESPTAVASQEPAAPGPSGAIASEAESEGLRHDLWLDPDVRWLTGVHDADGHTYLVQEPYEELLWWLQMPSIIKLAGVPSPDKASAARMASSVNHALAAASAAQYRVDLLAGQGTENASQPAISEPPAVEPADSYDPISDGVPGLSNAAKPN